MFFEDWCRKHPIICRWHQRNLQLVFTNRENEAMLNRTKSTIDGKQLKTNPQWSKERKHQCRDLMKSRRWWECEDKKLRRRDGENDKSCFLPSWLTRRTPNGATRHVQHSSCLKKLECKSVKFKVQKSLYETTCILVCPKQGIAKIQTSKINIWASWETSFGIFWRPVLYFRQNVQRPVLASFLGLYHISWQNMQCYKLRKLYSKIEREWGEARRKPKWEMVWRREYIRVISHPGETFHIYSSEGLMYLQPVFRAFVPVRQRSGRGEFSGNNFRPNSLRN